MILKFLRKLFSNRISPDNCLNQAFEFMKVILF